MVVMLSRDGGPWGGWFSGRLLEDCWVVVAVLVAAVGWRWWVVLLVVTLMSVWQGFVGTVWWLSLLDVVGAVRMVDWVGRMMVGKYISMVVWDRRRRELVVRAG